VLGLLVMLAVSQGPPPTGEPDAGAPSTPPVFESDVPLEAPPQVPSPTEKPTFTSVLHFAPVSMLITHFVLELEHAISKQVTVFAAIGGSLLLQAGLDLGVRAYFGERALEGPFVGVHGTLFYFSQATALLLVPGAMVGWQFNPRRSLFLSVGLGVQVWTQLTRETRIPVLGIQPVVDVVFVAGLQRPDTSAWAPQPLLRFTVGPGF
jgi:hypothetical protein